MADPPSTVHRIELRQDDAGGVVRSVCSCGRYTSTPTRDRQRAYNLGVAHAWRQARKSSAK